MKYTIREMIERNGRSLAQTDYVGSNPEMLNFRLFSGEHYSWQGDKLRFKENATVMNSLRDLTKKNNYYNARNA